MKYSRTIENAPKTNIEDVALIFEGGGMRASYTSAVVASLIENDLNFGKIYGISAGASNAVNYVSRDVPRALYSFTGFAADPNAINKGGLLKGEGHFNSHYLYEGVAERFTGPEDTMAFDWDMFMANPADVHIEAFDSETGETLAFTKADMPTMIDMMLQVRASSTLPIYMPPTEYGGRVLMDGGLGSSWGISLDAAKRDGFEKFFVVRTQVRGYRKKPMNAAAKVLFRRLFKDKPLVAENTIERWHNYNDVCDQLDELERAGAAYVFYPEKMEVTNRTTDLDKLVTSLDDGMKQAAGELETWKQWLGK